SPALRFTTLRPLLFPSQLQIRPDQLVQIPVEHAIDIANLDSRPQVFHHAIGLQHVRADLRPEVNVEFGIFDAFGYRALLLQFVLVKPRTEDAHGALAVLVLRTLVLAGDYASR